MPFRTQAPVIGGDLTRVDTVPTFALGSTTKAVDGTYGHGEFIYLRGVASIVVGSVVRYNEAFLCDLAGAGERGPVAVAMAAVVVNTYGWFQVAGMATLKAGTVAADTPVYLTATAGTVDDAVVAGDMVTGAVFQTADGTPSAGLAIASLSYPVANGAA